jgi:Zn-dependent M32 family carboxypeptidase
MAVENEPVNKIATAIAGAVADATSATPVVEGAAEEKLDAKAELFVRRITDSITKSIADLLKPAKPEDDDDDDNEDDSPVRRKRRQAPAPQPVKKQSIWSSIGIG